MVDVRNGNASLRMAILLMAGALALACFFIEPATAFAVDGQQGLGLAAGKLVVDAQPADEPAAKETSVVVAPQAAAGDTSWYVGKSSPYTIRTINQLIGLSTLVNNGTDTFKGKTVQFPSTVATLAFLGTSIVPIGTSAHPFEGTFDAKGWTISNLTLDAGSSLANVGLFGYAGDSAVIKNVRLAGGTVKVSNSVAGKTISNIGAIAGHLGGSIEGCYSSVVVDVANNGAAPEKAGSTSQGLCTITNVGGLVGSLGGNMSNCTHDKASLNITSKANVTEEVPYIAGYIGGLVGIQGVEDKPGKVTSATNCKNTGALNFNVSGSGGVDRFGMQMYSKSSMVGGIAGYAMGNVSGCTNTAAIQTGIVKNGSVQAGWGASNVGGIVGSLRGPTIAEAASATGVVGSNDTDPGYTVWVNSGGKTEPATIQITKCANTGTVTGLASVAGIAGSTGAFTKVVGCSNVALIEGTRWNKPCPAGIVGISNGDIAYCYNQGRCFSTTGGGYYASGIAALLTTYNTSSTADNVRLAVPEIYGCYVTGNIGGADTGYRTAVIAGENDGYIHDNCFLPNLTVDKASDAEIFGDEELHSRLVSPGEDRGTIKNVHELSADAMKTSEAVSYLNAPNAAKSDWSQYYVTIPGSFPILSWQGSAPSQKALTSAATGIAKVENPAYSAAYAPVPSVTLSTSGVKLWQNADYKVVVDADAKQVGRSYQATVEGINGYTGALSQKATYSIAKASIDTCTVSAAPSQFNWQVQSPKSVTVRDDAGNIVDPSEYTFRTLANSDKSTKAVNGKYYDYINCHGEGYKYDIEVTAKSSSQNFTGKTTQAAFRITWASLMYSPENDNRTDIPPSAKLGNVVYGGQEWDIAKALETKGYVKIKYTGEPIKPTCKTVTYLGRAMRNGTDKPYYYEPLNYDYMYVYGNPNPEDGSDLSEQNVNVTGKSESSLACMTVRFTSGGNFDNYTNVFFEITPASIAKDAKISGIEASYPYTGSAIEPKPKLAFNGKTLVEGTDYTLAYKNNTKVGTATLTVTGKGNFEGTVSKTFTIARASLAQATVKISNQTYASKALKPIPSVTLKGKALEAGTDFKVTYKNNTKAGTAKAVISGIGGYNGKKTVTFKIAKANLKKAKISNVGYTGKAVSPIVKVGGNTMCKGVDYTVTFKNAKGKKIAASKVKSIGSYTVTVKGKGSCKGSITKKFKVTKGKNTMTVKTRTVSVKASKVKKKAQVVKALTVKKAKGTVTYKKTSGNKKIVVNKKTGKLTLKKGLAKGAYTVKVKVKAKGTSKFKSAAKTVKITVKVK